MKKLTKDDSENLKSLKKELDSIEVEERLEMIQLTVVAAGCCCFCNDSCNGTCSED